MLIQYSVVIPAFNAASTILEAVESVMSQTLPPAEVIVVDDGSTDNTASVVSAMTGPVRLIRQTNRGPGAATTAGVATVATPLLATLDADDLWLPEKIRRQVEHLANDPSISAVFTLARTFGGIPVDSAGGLVQRLWTRTTMLIDTAMARSVGEMVDPPGGRGEMVDWLGRCRDMGYCLGMVEEVLALRRIRPGSLAYGRDEQRDKGYLHVARRALQRKRQLAAGPHEEVAR
ncbi:MAG: glycosyltransferase family 2 protein [Planctomycetia bacterium]|nr:glycosyltransferase family 2 protein [Planctomycetia bacterium]